MPGGVRAPAGPLGPGVSTGGWGRKPKDFKTFQEKTLEIPTLLAKQDLRGRILLSVTLLQKPSKSGGISQGHFRLGSDVRFPIA